MSAHKNIPLNQFKSRCTVFGPSSYISLQGIHLVGAETGTVCASYTIGKVSVGDRVYVRIPKEYGSPEYQCHSITKGRTLTGDVRTAPVHIEDDLWVITVKEADDEAWITLYSLADSPPKMYTAVEFLTFIEDLVKTATIVVASTITGVLAIMWGLS